MQSPEELLESLEFDPTDVKMLSILDNALECKARGSRFEFLVGAVKESARARLDVPHFLL